MLSLIVLAHVGIGSLAVLLGALAVSTRKGGSKHVTFGRWFVLFMTISSLLGAILGLIKYQSFFITFFAGLLAIYLVLSGWLTARNRGEKPSVSIIALGLLNAANFSALVIIGTRAISTETGQMFGFAGEDYLFLASMSGVGLLFDASLVFRKTVSEKHRIARHLWRMALGFFIAAGSAFTGPGAKAFPETIQQSGILSAPELLIFMLMLYYLARTLFFPSRRKLA